MEMLEFGGDALQLLVWNDQPTYLQAVTDIPFSASVTTCLCQGIDLRHSAATCSNASYGMCCMQPPKQEEMAIPEFVLIQQCHP